MDMSTFSPQAPGHVCRRVPDKRLLEHGLTMSFLSASHKENIYSVRVEMVCS